MHLRTHKTREHSLANRSLFVEYSSRIGYMTILLHYHLISHQTRYIMARKETKSIYPGESTALLIVVDVIYPCAQRRDCCDAREGGHRMARGLQSTKPSKLLPGI